MLRAEEAPAPPPPLPAVGGPAEVIRESRQPDPFHLRGVAQLALHATLEATEVVEAMHAGIARPWTALRREPPQRARGLTGWIYRCIRWTARHVGSGLDGALAALAPVLAESGRSERRESVVAALNGVLGDHLAAKANSLAFPMVLSHAGRELPRDAAGLAAALPDASERVVLLIHGLCRSDLHWRRGEHHHGEALARDLGLTTVALRYNSGRHVSENGRELAARLEALVECWPVPLATLSIVCHSMGGLVARSALHYGGLAGAGWPRRLRHLVFLGTPHHGAPLERGGQWLHALLEAAPYARPLARLGRIRSAGITDLRHGNLLDEDWQRGDRFARDGDRRQPVPLPAGVACGAIAASLREDGGTLHRHWVGDGLVPLDSALGRHRDPARTLAFPPERQWIARGLSHLDLLGSPEVYRRIRDWLAG